MTLIGPIQYSSLRAPDPANNLPFSQCISAVPSIFEASKRERAVESMAWNNWRRCSVMCHGVVERVGSTVERWGQSPNLPSRLCSDSDGSRTHSKSEEGGCEAATNGAWCGRVAGLRFISALRPGETMLHAPSLSGSHRHSCRRSTLRSGDQ